MQLNSVSGKHIGFFAGLILFALMLILPAPEGMKPEAWKVAAVTALMAVWWTTDAIPIPAIFLIPLFLSPPLGVLIA